MSRPVFLETPIYQVLISLTFDELTSSIQSVAPQEKGQATDL